MAHIDEARDLWHRSGFPTKALQTELGRMHVLDDLGRHGEAVTVGEELIAAIDRLPKRSDDELTRRQIQAKAVENIGVAYGYVGQHRLALNAYARADDAYRALGMHAEAALTSANRGVELLALGRPREALRDFGVASAGFAGQGDRLFAAQCQGDMAQAHRQLGEFTDALHALEEARATLVELGATAEADRLQVAIADCYLALGLFPEAIRAAGSAADGLAHAVMPHDTGTAHFIVALGQLGMGHVEQAEESLRLAADLFQRVNDRQYLARVRLAEAEAAALKGRRDEALALASDATDQLDAGGWLVPLAWAHLRRADLAATTDAVERDLLEAATLVEKLRLPELSYQYELRAARLCRLLGRDAEAQDRLYRAIENVERSSGALTDHAVRTAFRADKFAAYDELVDLLLVRRRPGDVQRACAVADDAKAKTLLDLLTESVGPGPDLNAQGTELRVAFADLNSTYVALERVTEPADRSALRQRAAELEQLVSTLRLQSIAAESANLDQRAVRRVAAAPSGATTLAFHTVGSDVLCFIIRDEDIEVQRLSGALPLINAELDALADQWTRFAVGSIFSRRNRDVMLRTTQAILGTLYDVIVRPIERYLGEIEDDHLYVVPHGRIGAVPFQALYDGSRYLVERCAITLTPTLTDDDTEPDPVNLTRPALVVAVPDPSTPAVAAEADIVVRWSSDATVLSGSAATVDAFKTHLAGSGVVHLACHGLYRPGNPLFSGLRLADRWLTSAEVVDLDLDGALVVLSACESGRFGYAAEPVSVGWAFLAAGASGVLASQWVVHDQATRILMGELYRSMAAGCSPPQALRRAQTRTAAEFPHPFFWAPFVYLVSPHLPARSMQ